MKIRNMFRFAVMVALVLTVFAGSFALAEEETSFEPVPVSWLTDGTMNGLAGVAKERFNVAVTKNGDTDTTVIDDNDTVTFTFNMDAANWEKAFEQSASTEEIRWPFGIIVHENAKYVGVAGVSTTYSNTDALNYIKGIYYNYVGDSSDRQLDQFTEIATITYDDTNAIITPKAHGRSYMFKWKDSSDKEHFHRINVQIVHNASNSVKVGSVTPAASRVSMNTTNLTNISCEYDDGTVMYMPVVEPVAGTMSTTAIAKPDVSDITKVRIIQQSGPSAVEDVGEDASVELRMNVSYQDRQENTFRLEWMNASDEILKREIIAIQVLPEWTGIWMDKYWIPAVKGDMPDANISNHIEYENGIATFSVNKDYVNELDMEQLCKEAEYFYIPVPEGATHIKYLSQHCPLYDDNLASQTRTTLVGKEYIVLDDLQNSSKHPLRLVEIDGKQCLAVKFGAIFQETKLANDGISIYTVNDSLAGYADMLHIRWYQYNSSTNEYSTIFRGNDIIGDYICMLKKPYMQEIKTDLGDAEDIPEAPVAAATALVESCPADWHYNGLKLFCEIPLQEQSESNITYAYMKLKLIDGSGNEVKLPPNTQLRVFLPYPQGIIQQNAWQYNFDVWHYENDDHSSYESMKNSLSLEAGGISFHTTSFSPFLLSYEDEYEPKLENVPSSIDDYTSKGYSTNTVKELQENLKEELDKDTLTVGDIHNYLMDEVAEAFDSRHGEVKSTIIEIVLKDAADKPIPEDQIADALGSNGIEVFIPFRQIGFADSQNYYKYRFEVRHMIMVPMNGYKTGQVEPITITNINEDGITIRVKNGFSPFVVAYAENPAASGSSGGSHRSASKPSIAYPSAPQQVDVAPGASVSMSVRASNASAYQWYIDRNDGRGFVAIKGANISTYTTSPVEASNNGYRYFCRISNGYGSVDSSIFTLNLGMNIPKTGDMPLWAAISAFFGF